MVNTGMTNISIDAPTDMAKAVAAARGKAVLIGNLNTNLFFTGSRDEMKQAMKNCIDKAPSDSGYILKLPGVAQNRDWDHRANFLGVFCNLKELNIIHIFYC